MAEKYEPSAEEIKNAEGMMTQEEEEMSRGMSREYWEARRIKFVEAQKAALQLLHSGRYNLIDVDPASQNQGSVPKRSGIINTRDLIIDEPKGIVIRFGKEFASGERTGDEKAVSFLGFREDLPEDVRLCEFGFRSFEEVNQHFEETLARCVRSIKFSEDRFPAKGKSKMTEQEIKDYAIKMAAFDLTGRTVLADRLLELRKSREDSIS